jgi:L-threonylcarbamoyladenylate synthase
VERHYAPRAAVWLFDPTERAAVAVRLRAAPAHTHGRVGALLLSPWDESPAPDVPLPMPDDPAAYARRLYAALHQLDDEECAIALVERPPDLAAWQGVRDRLARAAR